MRTNLDAQEQGALECRPGVRHEAPRRFGIPAIQLGLDACQRLAVVLTVKPLVRPAFHHLVRMPLAFVGPVGGEPHEVHARAQLGFEKAVPPIRGGGQQGRQPTRDLANVALKQQCAEQEDLGAIRLPGGTRALFPQDDQRALAQPRRVPPFAGQERRHAGRERRQRLRVRVARLPRQAGGSLRALGGSLEAVAATGQEPGLQRQGARRAGTVRRPRAPAADGGC